MATRINQLSGTVQAELYLPAIAATSATALVALFHAVKKCKVKNIYFRPNTALSGDATNSIFLNFLDGDDDGDGTAEFANKDYLASVDMVALELETFTPATPPTLDAGDVVLLQVYKHGTGGTCPAGVWTIEYEYA